MGIHDFTIYDLICRNAVSLKNKPAWFEVDDGRTMTFGQYKEKVDRLAGGLQKAGINKGDRIGVLGKNSLEYFLLYGAAAACGAIILTINWRLSVDEAVFNLNDGNPKMLFVDSEFQKMIETTKDKLPSVKSYYNLKPDGRFGDFEDILKNQDDFKPPGVSSDDGFVIIHTAAVAARPRGALLSHENLVAASIHLNYLFNLVPADAHLNLLPLFHVGGLFMAINTFHAGALNVNMSKFDAKQAVDLIADKSVSVLFDFSPILSAILEEHAKTGKDIKSLKAVLGIDTPETIEKYQQVTGGTFYCIYGQTETSGMATMGKYDDKPGSAGKTLQLADVRLVDDNDNPVPVGQIGEITVKGPLVFKGYWNLPEATANAFRGDCHHTGDLGRFDENGFLWYEGRKADKELIKPGGENVYPAEVERVILQHPAVEKTVVFGVPDPKWKEGIKAVCKLKPGQNLEPQELISFVGERIASYKKPQYVAFVTDLPVLKDGFPDRDKVKAMYGGVQK
jgi:long-chain acyl-CoA synthetase